MDKRNKLTFTQFQIEMNKLEVSSEQQETLFHLDSSQVFEDCKRTLPEVSKLYCMLEKAGLSEWFTFDTSIVRGLEYYTGIVFEIFSKPYSVKNRAICGGGRYDKLFNTFEKPNRFLLLALTWEMYSFNSSYKRKRN